MIRFDHVSKQYSGTTRPALNAVNLEVLRGEFVFLVGASGSGKSSCLRLMLKEEKPSKGKIHVLGQDLGTISSRKVPYFRRNIGVVFQDFRLLPNKSVFDNVAFTLQVIGKSRGFIQEAVPDVLGMVGLEGKASRLPHELSGGEQQRVAIARAVVNKPQVLLADEPTGNLDPLTSAGIMSVLERINAGGTTVIMATHEAGIVDQMQRRVIELVNGQIVRDERHGGYGFTAAIPTAKAPVSPAVADVPAVIAATAPPLAVPQPPAPVSESIAAHTFISDAPGSERNAETLEAMFAAEELSSRDPAPSPATPADSEPTTETDTAQTQLSAHFAAPPTHPVVRPILRNDSELPEQLTLAEKLGLRVSGGADDGDNEQNVGPTR